MNYTNKQFREDWLKQSDVIRAKITENFDAFCDVAAVVKSTPMRIDVPQGYWFFRPDPKFAYKFEE